MDVILLRSKIHRATVTSSNLNYIGSITIDQRLIEAVGLFPFEQVHVVNVTNGQRLITYVIEGEPDTGTICLNGAAARLVAPGDIIIVLAYVHLNISEAPHFKPTILFVDEKNRMIVGP